MTVRLPAITTSQGLLHPNQCGSFPGLSSFDAFLTLSQEIRILQRPRLKVSTLFLDIKTGFDNLDTSTLRARLLAFHVPSYMVDSVSSFLSERTCTLVFQGVPTIRPPVSVGIPQGSPISPLLFQLYVTPLHMSILKGLMVSYVDDFSITVASPSHRGNIWRLPGFFSSIATRGRDMEVSFSVPKTELIYWRTPSQRSPSSTVPIELEGQIFHPSHIVRWLRYWFHPSPHHHPPIQAWALPSPRHLRVCQTPVFSWSRNQVFLCHRIANGLLLPILTYGVDLFTPNSSALMGHE